MTYAPPADTLPEMIPEAIKATPHWLTWRAEPNGNKKPRKIPYYINGKRRQGQLDSPADLANLVDFDTAWTAYRANPDRWAGLGFAVTGEGIAAFDLDNCVDDLVGVVDPDSPAAHIVDEAKLAGLYMETSPSGTGLRIFGQASILDALADSGNGIESDARGRFLTVTGNVFANPKGWGNLDPIRARLDRPPAVNDAMHQPAIAPTYTVDDKTVFDLRSALLTLRADERGLWVSMGHALKTLGDVGRGLWLEWSTTSEKFDPADAARVWDSLKSERTDYRAVFSEAARHGWANPIKYRDRLEATDQAGERLPLLVPATTLLENPSAPAWLVRGMLEREVLALLFGDPAAGKSFVALDLAAAIATGADWHGRVSTPGSVVYVAGEGHAGLARRLKAWEVHHQQTLPERFRVSRRAIPMLDVEAVSALAQEIETLPEAPSLIVIDTLARAFAGGDENSTEDMGSFIAACDHLKARFKAAVLVVHHSGHGDKGRARGSSSLKGALDAEYSLKTDLGGLRTLECTKMKDTEPFSPMAFTLQSVVLPWEDDEGMPVTSAVPVLVDMPSAPAKRKKMTAAQKLGLDTFFAVAVDGRADLESWRDEFYKRHTGDGTEAKRKAFNRARKDMTEAGALSVKNDVYTFTPEQCPLQEIASTGLMFSEAHEI